MSNSTWSLPFHAPSIKDLVHVVGDRSTSVLAILANLKQCLVLGVLMADVGDDGGPDRIVRTARSTDTAGPDSESVADDGSRLVLGHSRVTEAHLFRGSLQFA